MFAILTYYFRYFLGKGKWAYGHENTANKFYCGCLFHKLKLILRKYLWSLIYVGSIDYFTLVHEKSRKPSTWNKIFLMDQWFLHLRNTILQPRRVGLRETDGSLFLQNVGKHLARENLDSRVLLLGEKLRFFRRHWYTMNLSSNSWHSIRCIAK